MDYQTLRKHEFETTLRVLGAFPDDKINLKPAEKSRTAGELATTLAAEERVIKALIETGATNPQLARLQTPATMGDAISLWQEAASTNDARIAELSAADLGKVVDFYGMKIPLGDALWLELLDHIHHRGQFSVYLRLAGAKVPSIYGPTADDQVG
jgi:uncharacterized damage-inducible protein DinB